MFPKTWSAKRRESTDDEEVELMQKYYSNDKKKFCPNVGYKYIGLIIAIVSCLVFVTLLSYFLLFGGLLSSCNEEIIENEECRITLVESIPENLTYNGSVPSYYSTYKSWMMLLKQAKHSVDIVSFYWTLRGTDVHNETSAWQGENVFNELLKVVKRGVKLRIIQNMPSKYYPNEDTQLLTEAGAEVLSLDMSHFYDGGVLHTKLWVVDDEMLYLGSANMDWRSLNQVKELGALVSSCKTLARDASKLVEVYAYLAKHKKFPFFWQCRFRTHCNKDDPFDVKLNGTNSRVYFSSSPREFCPPNRTPDLDAILDVIQKAKTFVNIAVMDYAPAILFGKSKKFWPLIDDALRKVALDRKVKVRFLASLWNHTKHDMVPFLKSLAALNDATSGVSVKLFCVPATSLEEKSIPYARVNHNKYMVTDDVAYIGTSNWSGDYFIDTAGVALVVNQTSHPGHQNFRDKLLQVFMRDWTSEHVVDIWKVNPNNLSLCDFY